MHGVDEQILLEVGEPAESYLASGGSWKYGSGEARPTLR